MVTQRNSPKSERFKWKIETERLSTADTPKISENIYLPLFGERPGLRNLV